MPKFSPALLLAFWAAVAAPAAIAGDGGKPVRLLGLESNVGADWEEQQPTSTMRLLQYGIPGASGSGAAAFVVYHFGPGQGGTNEANIERWQSQFTSADGSPVTPVVTSLKAGELPVTLVELKGSYARSLGMGQRVDALPDQTLLAAIVETGQGNLFAQMHGPSALVAAQRAAFEAFLRGLKPAAAP